MKDVINQRFKECINYLLLNNIEANKAKISAKLDLRPSLFSEILNKRVNVNVEHIVNLCEKWNFFNSEWLLTGKGEMLKENAEPKSIRQSLKGDNNTQVGSGTATIHKVNNEELDYLKEELKEYKKLLLEKDKQIALKDANISKMQDQIISLLNK